MLIATMAKNQNHPHEISNGQNCLITEVPEKNPRANPVHRSINNNNIKAELCT